MSRAARIAKKVFVSHSENSAIYASTYSLSRTTCMYRLAPADSRGDGTCAVVLVFVFRDPLFDAGLRQTGGEAGQGLFVPVDGPFSHVGSL